MRRISRSVIAEQFARDDSGAVTIDQGLVGSLACVGCFAVFDLFATPFANVVGRVFVLSIAIAAIAGISVAYRKMYGLGRQNKVDARITP